MGTESTHLIGAPLKEPVKPQPPADEDCCRSDCTHCVFNLYDRELERWEAAHALWRAAMASTDSTPAP